MFGVPYNECKCIPLFFDLPVDVPVGGGSTRICSIISVLLQTAVRVSRRLSQGVSGENLNSQSMVKSSPKI